VFGLFAGESVSSLSGVLRIAFSRGSSALKSLQREVNLELLSKTNYLAPISRTPANPRRIRVVNFPVMIRRSHLSAILGDDRARANTRCRCLFECRRSLPV